MQFEELRKDDRYQKMKTIVEKRDLEYSGPVNPMLSDFGTRSEVFQYSGRAFSPGERCPFDMQPGEI